MDATKTKAVAYLANLPIDDPSSLVDAEVDVAPPGPRDLLVDVRAVSVNPVDTKVRASTDPHGVPKVLGYDASGVVAAVGSDVELFEVGDEVYYAGSIARQGSNAGLQLVDERITGAKPASLDFAEAAAMPLTTITAWEALFDRPGVDPDSEGTLLVMGGAGGVGSMMVQLARRLTRLTVIATASRPESAEWARGMGAHHVVDRHELAARVRQVAPEGVDYVFSPFSAGNVEAFAEVLKVRGAIIAIDDARDIDLLALKPKSISWHWEFMFTRPLYEPESTYQHELLDEVSRLIDEGVLRSTLTTRLGPLNARTLRQAHEQVESSTTIGKVVVTQQGS